MGSFEMPTAVGSLELKPQPELDLPGVSGGVVQEQLALARRARVLPAGRHVEVRRRGEEVKGVYWEKRFLTVVPWRRGRRWK